jgi:hypothetical protein
MSPLMKLCHEAQGGQTMSDITTRPVISLVKNPEARPFVYTDDHRVHRTDVACSQVRKTRVVEYLTRESAAIVLTNRDGHGCGCLIAQEAERLLTSL